MEVALHNDKNVTYKIAQVKKRFLIKGSLIIIINIHLRLYFRSLKLRVQIGPNFPFFALFVIIDKIQRVRFKSQGRSNSYPSNIEDVHSIFRVLSDFTLLGNAPKYAVDEENQPHIKFKD